jgi:ATP-dependent DNA helicase Rep
MPGNFTCVGDDDQSIYAWRGANPDNLLATGKDYPALQIVKLEQNYRCSNRVLRAANALIANNPHEHPKTLWSDQADGERIRVWECRDSEHEAEKVAAEIQFVHTAARVRRGAISASCSAATTSRAAGKGAAAAAHSLPPERRHRVPGPRQEVKDALAWLRLLANPDDDAAFLRAVQSPKREVGATSLAKLGELASTRTCRCRARPNRWARWKAVAAARGQCAERVHRHPARPAQRHARSCPPAIWCGAQRTIRACWPRCARSARTSASVRSARRGNLDELADWFDGPRVGASAGDLAAHWRCCRADKDDGGNQVRLMSLHAAKGLEFRFVFIVGCEDGTLPHEASLDEGNLDEERRLLYVGITRAKSSCG